MSLSVFTKNPALEDAELRTHQVISKLVFTGSATASAIRVSSSNPGVFIAIDQGTPPTTYAGDAGVTWSTITSTASATDTVVGLVVPCLDAATLVGLEVFSINGTGAMTAATFATAGDVSGDFTTATLHNIAVALTLTGFFLKSAVTQTFGVRVTYLRASGY